MNSNFYEILTSVNTCWLIRLPKQLADIEQAFEELKETLKANQLNHPEAFKAYCLAALDQIDAEYKRLDAEYYDNIEYDFPKYEFYLSQILSTTFEALQLIIEYLGTYSPEVFTDYKIDLLCEYLPDSHPIRRKIMEGLIIKNQQLRAAKLEQENTITDQQIKTLKPESQPILKFPQIALLYVFENRNPITRENCKQIAQKFGHEAKGKTAGQSLYNDYIFYSNRQNRRSLPKAETRKTMENKIELFQSVIDYPNLTEQAKQTAIEELNTLKTIANKHFGLDL
jgi:hypothetical protein